MGCTTSSVKDPYASGYKEITYKNINKNIVNNKKEHITLNSSTLDVIERQFPGMQSCINDKIYNMTPDQRRLYIKTHGM
jgi:hypothetical protein